MAQAPVVGRVIVAGSRTINDYAIFRALLLEFLKEHFHGEAVEIVTGRALDGPDDMAYHFARWDLRLPFVDFPAKWKEHGKPAGMIRNREMGIYARGHNGHLFNLWDGTSKGTKNMIQVAHEFELTTKTCILEPENLIERYEIIPYEEDD